MGNPVRNPVTNSGNSGGVILDGVTEDGKVNTKRVVIDANSTTLPQAAFSYDASYVKLREATLTYTFPKTMISKWGPVKWIDLSVFGRNLWIIHKTFLIQIRKRTCLLGMHKGYKVEHIQQPEQ